MIKVIINDIGIPYKHEVFIFGIKVYSKTLYYDEEKKPKKIGFQSFGNDFIVGGDE